jgi:alkylation response protein AidB-like acyl-CoA dehydrogenase
MQFELTQDEALVSETFRRFADRGMRPAAADADREARIPAPLLQQAVDLGFFADAVVERAGGFLEGAYSHRSRALRGLHLGWGCPAMAEVFERGVELALLLAEVGGFDEVLADLATPDGTAVLVRNDGRLGVLVDGAEARVLGVLPAVPGAALSKWLAIASTEPGAEGLFLVSLADTERQDATAEAWKASGAQRIGLGGVAARVVTTDVERVTRLLDEAKVSLAARAVGAARAAIEFAEAYGRDRVQFDQPIGEFEALRELVDASRVNIEAAEALVLRAAAELDARTGPAPLASMARRFASDVVRRAAVDAVQIYGGYGYVNDYPVEKLMRDATAFAVRFGSESFERVRRG